MKKFFAAAFFAAMCASAQGFTPETEKLAGMTPVMAERAAAFREAVQSGTYRSAAYVYTKRSIADYAKDPLKLAARLAVLGFSDVYLGCETALGGEDDRQIRWQKAFMEAAHQNGIKVHALRLSSGKLLVGNEKLYEDCRSVVDYNYSVKKSQRFDGISADLEPHIFKAGFVDRPKELKWAWGNDNYGPGGDNDQMLERSVEVMKLAKKEIAPLQLSQAMGFFVQPRVNSGLLIHGGAGEFLKYCDFLVVMAYNWRAERVWEMARPLIEDAGGKPASVSVCVKTSQGTVGDEGPVTSLQPHGWDNFIEAMKFLTAKGSEYKSFRGVDIFEFQGMEMMWEDKVPAAEPK